MYDKLLKIQNKLKVEKKHWNKFGEFHYRSCEDILESVKPVLKEHGLVLLLNDDVVQCGNYNYIKATATLTDGTNTIQTTAFAKEPDKPKAKMDDSQTTGSTSSYARKFALNGFFLLDDAKDPDQPHKEVKKKVTHEIVKDKTSSQCEECAVDIQDRVFKFSKDKYGVGLCYNCQQKRNLNA